MADLRHPIIASTSAVAWACVLAFGQHVSCFAQWDDRDKRLWDKVDALEHGGHVGRAVELLSKVIAVRVDPLIQAAFANINEDRGQFGAPQLKLSPELSRVAQSYADFLMRTNTFAHIDPSGRNPEDRARAMGVTVPVAENLAMEESSFEDPHTLLRRAEAGMMAEPANQMNHRFNILNPRHRYVGVGVAHVGFKTILVQEFSERQP